jgi:dihydroorotate dehydrogenase
MYEVAISTRNAILSFLYRNVLKRAFFLRDPEDVHNGMIKTGTRLGAHRTTRTLTRAMFFYENRPILEQNILGITFANPIGLSAGFDKNAELVDILPSVGFGFAELGSITGEPCEGNPKPRLWRLKNSQSLGVYYGLKNDGCRAISERLAHKQFKIPIGISIAKTNSQNTVDVDRGISDYAKAFGCFTEIGDYITVNISCPNAYGGEPFTDPEKLNLLFTSLDEIKTNHPIFIKFSPDLALEQIDALLDVVKKHRIHGFVCTNLTKRRDLASIKDPAPEKGGLSGKIVESLADNLIEYIYKKTEGKYIIIGCGGVFSADDAYKKIRKGASLIQLITGMIFMGPQVVSEINQGLARLLARDGFKNISESIGADINIKTKNPLLPSGKSREL